MIAINSIEDLEVFIIENYETKYKLTIEVVQKCLDVYYLPLFEIEPLNHFITKVRRHYDFISNTENEKPLFLLEEPTEPKDFTIDKLINKKYENRD
jgi:hypothetical protein